MLDNVKTVFVNAYCLYPKTAEFWQQLVTSHTQEKLFLIIRQYNHWVYLRSQFFFFFLNVFFLNLFFFSALFRTLLQQIFSFYKIFYSKICFATSYTCHVWFCFIFNHNKVFCFFLAPTKLY